MRLLLNFYKNLLLYLRRFFIFYKLYCKILMQALKIWMGSLIFCYCSIPSISYILEPFIIKIFSFNLLGKIMLCPRFHLGGNPFCGLISWFLLLFFILFHTTALALFHTSKYYVLICFGFELDYKLFLNTLKEGFCHPMELVFFFPTNE